jgi:hypothetical protein
MVVPYQVISSDKASLIYKFLLTNLVFTVLETLEITVFYVPHN